MGKSGAKTSARSAVLTWADNSNNETSFVSQYKVTGSSTWIAGPSVGANSTAMTVPGLRPGTPYTFQVGARNVAGTHWSAYATGNTPQVLPAQPASPRVTSATGASAVLAWTDASDNEAGFVSQYRIGSGSWVAGPSVGANRTSMTVTGLKTITIVCYVTGQSITGPYDTTNIWDLAGDGYYYTDAWLYTGTNGPAVPAC